MIAAAGRGKSALLVQWTQQVQAYGEAYVAFIPISIRFDTASELATYQALAGRIAEIYDEPLHLTDRPPAEWQDVYLTLLRREPPDGKPILIILDGLDEATATLPRHVRGIISARDVDDTRWRRQLGWNAPVTAANIKLPKLTRAGIADVLQAMGNPLDQLVTKVDILAELERLSEGDPLVEMKAVKAFFDVCAAALGPLSREDVMALAPDELRSGLTLKRATADVGRLILGDGEARGYVFSHPRLNQHFWNQMSHNEQHAWERRFLSYGQITLKALNNHELEPPKAPPNPLLPIHHPLIRFHPLPPSSRNLPYLPFTPSFPHHTTPKHPHPQFAVAQEG